MSAGKYCTETYIEYIKVVCTNWYLLLLACLFSTLTLFSPLSPVFSCLLMPSALSFSLSPFFLLFSSTLALPKAMLWINLPFGVVLFRGFYFAVYDLRWRKMQYPRQSQRGVEDWCGFCRASFTTPPPPPPPPPSHPSCFVVSLPKQKKKSKRGGGDFCGFLELWFPPPPPPPHSVHIHFSVVFSSYKEMEREITHCNCMLTLFFFMFLTSTFPCSSPLLIKIFPKKYP